MADDEAPNYVIIAQSIRDGDVVPFLGAGASAADRPDDDENGWDTSKPYLPFGFELARNRLAPLAEFPDPELETNLPLVASYVEHVASDRRFLNRRLHEIFCRDYRPGTIHRLFAKITQPLLIVTTNYDDLMERAFDACGRQYHMVVDRGDKSRVWVVGGNGFEPVKTTDLRKALLTEDRPIIYKLHGCIDKDNAENDSFVITEQDYVDLLGRAETWVPPYLATRMAKSRFLFLGYSLADWNVRVMLRKLRQSTRPQDDQLRSWAINKNPGAAERKIWEAHKVKFYDLDIRVFVDHVARALGIAIDERGD